LPRISASMEFNSAWQTDANAYVFIDHMGPLVRLAPPQQQPLVRRILPFAVALRDQLLQEAAQCLCIQLACAMISARSRVPSASLRFVMSAKTRDLHVRWILSLKKM